MTTEEMYEKLSEKMDQNKEAIEKIASDVEEIDRRVVELENPQRRALDRAAYDIVDATLITLASGFAQGFSSRAGAAAADALFGAPQVVMLPPAGKQ